MAVSSTNKQETFKFVKQELSEDFKVSVENMSHHERALLRDEINQEMARLGSQNLLLMEKITEEEKRQGKEAKDVLAKAKAKAKQIAMATERDRDIQLTVTLQGVENPINITITKSSTVADLRDEVATHHPAFVGIRHKTKKEEFQSSFVLRWGDKVFDVSSARPTLGGPTLRMTGGEQLHGYSAEEFESLNVTEQ